MEETDFTDEIDLRELMTILLKRIKWIIAGAVVGGILALLFTIYAVTPNYRSNTTMMVNGSKSSIGDIASGFDLGSLNLNQKLVVTYSEIVKSRIVLEAVIERMDLDMTYTQLLNSISASPVNSTEILRITVDNEDPGMAAEIANTIADVFIKEVMRILKVNNVEVIDLAIPMLKPTNIQTKTNVAIGFILGTMLVVFSVFLIEFLDQSVKTEEDVQKYIDLPVIGSIIDFDRAIKEEGEDIRKELIVHSHPKSPISEAYRAVRTNIQFANVDHGIKTILVTSTTPGEGKTTTLINIAVTMAQADHKVLIIDADMRKPRVHKAVEIKNNKGLAELLLEQGPTKDYIQRNQELGVDILTSGNIPANPSELVQSKAMKKLIESLKEEYDYIFIDTPPILPVTDSTIMSTYIDGTIVVVRYGVVNREFINKSKKALINVGANILGVVLTRIQVQDSKAYNSYYYYYAEDNKKDA